MFYQELFGKIENFVLKATNFRLVDETITSIGKPVHGGS